MAITPEQRKELDKKEAKLAEVRKKYGADSKQAQAAKQGVIDYRSQIGVRVGQLNPGDTGYPTPSNLIRTDTPAVQPTSGPLNLPGADNVDQNGLMTNIAGSGSPVGAVDGNAAKGVFGEYADEALSSGELYEDVMPLYMLDPSLSGNQLHALEINRQAAEAAQHRDPVQDQFVQLMLDRATKGLNAPELTALREEGLEGIGNQFEAALRQLSLRNAGSGVSGPAGTIGQNAALNQSMQARRGLERDIITKNTDFMNQNAQSGFSAANRANDSYFSNLATAGQNYWNNATQGAQQVIGVQQWNAGQGENYALGKLGAITGGADWAQAKDNTDKANKLAEKAINKGVGGAPAAGYSGSSMGNNYGEQYKKSGSGSVPNY